jgi:hypothetical protein
MRILAINGRRIGKSLAFGRRGTYNPAIRKNGSEAIRSSKNILFPVPCQKESRAFQSRIRMQSGPAGMQLLLVSETRFPVELFPKRSKEPY